METVTYRYTLIGRTPLLMHANNYEFDDIVSAYQKDPRNKNKTKAGDDRTPGWRWLGYIYHDGERVAMPVDNIYSSLKTGAAQHKIKGNTTYKSLAQTAFEFEEMYATLTYGKEQRSLSLEDLAPLQDEEDFTEHLQVAKKCNFTLHRKRARVGKNMHLRVRPLFEHWRLTGTLHLHVRDIPLEIAESILEHSGRRGGIADWRPSTASPGRFGIYTCELTPL